MKYEEVYEDWEYLWGIGPADDMTGGYVDQEDLDKLLKKPTKATAKACLLCQIGYWFQVGPDMGNAEGAEIAQLTEQHPRITEIAEKYAISY